MKNVVGIYVIISPTKKFYVGQSWNISKRWSKYKNSHAKNQPGLMNSLVKHGVEKHEFIVLKEYFGACQLELNALELKYWKIYSDMGYESLNCREPNGSFGKLTDEAKKKISIAHKGRVAPNKGKKLTIEQLLKRPKTNLGKICIVSTREKMRLANSGENNASSKLKLSDVNDIKKLLKSGMKQVQIAKEFKISKQTISNIKLGINWNN